MNYADRETSIPAKPTEPEFMKWTSCTLAGCLLVASLWPHASLAKTLVYCSEGSPENFNPQLDLTGTSYDAEQPIYNNLVEFKLGTTEIIPGLAESWDISADGLTYIFHLRKGVKFHKNHLFTPTRDFNADDVIFSFDRQWKEGNPYHSVSGGTYYYFADMSFPKLLKSIEKLDDYTVRFTLTEPQAPFLSDLGMNFTSILSAEYADMLLKQGKPELIDQDPIGTGPFEFVQYQKDALIRYKKFPDFWGPKAKLDGLVFAITKDPSVRLAKLQAGECQVSSYPTPADLPTIKADPKLQLLDQPGLNVGYLAFNTLKKPFDDKRVRLAVTMAIDKQAILAAVYQGAGQPAKNLIPPTVLGFNDAIQDYPHDVAAAKKLLAEAGLPDGFETDLWAMPVQRPYNPDARRVAELIQADLAAIGVKAHIVTYEWGEYIKRVNLGEPMLAENGWTGDNGDPDNFYTELLSCAAARIGGSNASKWCNKDFDALINKAARLTDPAARADLYRQAEVIQHDEQPIYLIAHSITYVPLLKTVKGYKMSPLSRHQFDDVDLE